MLEIVILLVGCLALFTAGAPVTFWVFRPGREGRISVQAAWALAPFAGFAMITCITKILVALDWPVKYTAWPVMAVFLVIFLVFLFRAIQKKRIFLPPMWFWIAAAAILALTGFAYVIIGAKYYQGFAWWDMFFYGSQAEFLKESPFSQMGALCETSPYLGATQWYFQGCHRISRGILQAFVASLCGVDGASTLGFAQLLGGLFVFCALLYVTDRLPIKAWTRYLAAFFGATLPIVTLTQLEGFVPVCMFISFAIVFCKLFLDTLEETTVWKALFGGTLTAAFLTTLLDGTYLFIGLLLISLVCVFITKRRLLKPLLGAGLTCLTVVLWNIPFLKEFIRELTGTISRQGLNFIYSFAYTPKALTWTFFGTTLENSAGLPGMILRFTAILMLIAAVTGMVMYFIRKHHPETLNFLALMFLPLVFMSFQKDYSYSFFKLYSLSAPLLALGIWLFWDLVRDELKKVFLKLESEKLAQTMKKAVFRGGTAVLCILFSFCTLCTVHKTNQTLTRVERGRKDPLPITFSKQAMAQYDQVSALKDQNLLYISGDVNLSYWWMTYYGRHNQIYSLTREIDDTYFKDKEYERTDYKNIPLDAKIFVLTDMEPVVYPEDKRQDCAAVLQAQANSKMGTLHKKRPRESSSFRLPVFSRYKQQAELVFKVQAPKNKGPVDFEVNGGRYTAEDSIREIRVPMELIPGGQQFTIRATAPGKAIVVSDWRVEIKS